MLSSALLRQEPTKHQRNVMQGTGFRNHIYDDQVFAFLPGQDLLISVSSRCAVLRLQPASRHQTHCLADPSRHRFQGALKHLPRRPILLMIIDYNRVYIGVILGYIGLYWDNGK